MGAGRCQRFNESEVMGRTKRSVAMKACRHEGERERAQMSESREGAGGGGIVSIAVAAANRWE